VVQTLGHERFSHVHVKQWYTRS